MWTCAQKNFPSPTFHKITQALQYLKLCLWILEKLYLRSIKAVHVAFSKAEVRACA